MSDTRIPVSILAADRHSRQVILTFSTEAGESNLWIYARYHLESLYVNFADTNFLNCNYHESVIQ